jgi:hypothetical protein
VADTGRISARVAAAGQPAFNQKSIVVTACRAFSMISGGFLILSNLGSSQGLDPLREAVCRPSERLSGLELVGEHNYAEITRQMQMEAEKMIDLNRGKGIERAIPEIDRGNGH